MASKKPAALNFHSSSLSTANPAMNAVQYFHKAEEGGERKNYTPVLQLETFTTVLGILFCECQFGLHEQSLQPAILPFPISLWGTDGANPGLLQWFEWQVTAFAVLKKYTNVKEKSNEMCLFINACWSVQETKMLPVAKKVTQIQFKYRKYECTVECYI